MAKTWRKYVQLVEYLLKEAGESSFRVVPEERHPREEEVLRKLSARLGKRVDDPLARSLLGRLDIQPSYLAKHLRYVADMSGGKRQQLAGGAALRLLQEATDAQIAALQGEQLRGSVREQWRQLRSVSYEQTVPEPTVDQDGWIKPWPTPVHEDRRLPPIWLYDPVTAIESTALDPTVARAILQTCLPKPGGRVIDPMAGTGVFGLEASRMGHFAWLSDLHPEGRAYIRKHDLLQGKADQNFTNRLTGKRDADCLILHPPLRRQLQRGAQALEDFVADILDRTVPIVKPAGTVVLILSVREAPDALQMMAQLLTDLVAKNQGMAQQEARPSGGLRSHHLAVSTDGQDGWHILIAEKDKEDV